MSTPINKFTTATVIGEDKLRIADFIFGESYANIWQINFPYIYNGFTIVDGRNIAAAGAHAPSTAEWQTLIATVGPMNAHKVRATGTSHWNAPNDLSTDETKFNARGAGWRGTGGQWGEFKTSANFFTTSTMANMQNTASIYPTNPEIICIPSQYANRKLGQQIALIMDDPNFTGKYIGNDLKEYTPIKIGNQLWITNLCETKFRDGSIIAGPNFTNTEWGALTTPAYCFANGLAESDGKQNTKPCKISVSGIWVKSRERGSAVERYENLTPNIVSMKLITETTEAPLALNEQFFSIDKPFWIEVQLNDQHRMHFNPSSSSEYQIQMFYNFFDCPTNTQIPPEDVEIISPPVILPEPDPAVTCPVNGYTLDTPENIETEAREIGMIFPEESEASVFCPANGYTLDTPENIETEAREIGMIFPAEIDPAIICPLNGYSKNKRKTYIIDTMTLEDFKTVAARRIKQKPEQTRVRTEVFNIQTGVDPKTLNLSEIQKTMTTSYIKNIQVLAIQDDGAGNFSNVLCIDNHAHYLPENEPKTVWSSEANKAAQGTNFFADQIEIGAHQTVQVVAYIAERLF